MPSIRVSKKTHEALSKMQAYAKLETGVEPSFDMIVWTFIEKQPRVDLVKRPTGV